MDYEYAFCYGIVKGKMPKNVRTFTASGMDSAIRKVKSYAKNDYSSRYKEATLFHNGTVSGWCFKNDGQMIFLDRFDMESMGLVTKRK